MQFLIPSFISLIHEPIGEKRRPAFPDKRLTHIIKILQNMIAAVIVLVIISRARYITKTMAGKLLYEVFYNTVMSDTHTEETERYKLKQSIVADISVVPNYKTCLTIHSSQTPSIS